MSGGVISRADGRNEMKDVEFGANVFLFFYSNKTCAFLTFFVCLFLYTLGAGSSEETVDAVQNPVGSATEGPLLNALYVLHGHLHHRGAGLHVPPRVQRRASERLPHKGLGAGGSEIRRHVRLDYALIGA